MATELIYRTKLRRLTNQAHYTLINDIYMWCRLKSKVHQKLSQPVNVLLACYEKEAEYVNKRIDKSLTKKLKDAIKLQNKQITALYKMIKYKADTATDVDTEAETRYLVSVFETYMKDRAKKTLAEWIGAERLMCDFLADDRGFHAFDRIKMVDQLNDLCAQRDVIDAFYREIKTNMVESGYTKIAQYRQASDAAVGYLAATYTCLLNDVNTQESEKVIIREELDGLNFMIENYSTHRSNNSDDDTQPENSTDNAEIVPSLKAETPTSTTTIEDEENAIKESEEEANSLNSKSLRTMKNIAERYADEQSPFDDIDNIPMTEIDESLR